MFKKLGFIVLLSLIPTFPVSSHELKKVHPDHVEEINSAFSCKIVNNKHDYNAYDSLNPKHQYVVTFIQSQLNFGECLIIFDKKDPEAKVTVDSESIRWSKIEEIEYFKDNLENVYWKKRFGILKLR